MGLFKRMLVGVDGSRGSMKALRTAVILARESDATLHALSVAEPPPRFAATIGEVDEEWAAGDDHYARVQADARRLAEEQGVALTGEVVHGHPSRSIVDAVEAGSYDLLVMGQSGFSGVWGPFLGTTTDKVSHHARCSILIVR